MHVLSSKCINFELSSKCQTWQAGLVYSEKGNLGEILCKPKLIPIKSRSLTLLEEKEKELQGGAGATILLRLWGHIVLLRLHEGSVKKHSIFKALGLRSITKAP